MLLRRSIYEAFGLASRIDLKLAIQANNPGNGGPFGFICGGGDCTGICRVLLFGPEKKAFTRLAEPAGLKVE